MDETSTITATVAAAAKAAGEGDYDAAERYLREVVALQEASFGPVHPDLANTLNNLGVACEHAGRLDAAEDSYRRAYAIAERAFAPDHPFVIRSAENLRDFCEARGRPFETVGARPVAPLPPHPVAPVPVSRLPLAETPLIQVDSPHRVDAPARRSWFLPFLLVAGVVAALLAWWLWPAIAPGIAPVPETTSAEAPQAPAASARPEPAPAEPESVPAEQETTPADAETVAPETSIASAEAATSPPSTSAGQPAPEVPRPTASAAGSVAVVRADVCRNFLPRGNQWRCDVVDSATAPGALVFFTRIRSPKPARIEHYWYRGDELIQRVELRVGANAGEGYRTFSRNTVTAAGAGQWRVELRAGGAVLHEEQFTVAAR